MKALVIDDARGMRLILRQLLEPLGFEVVEAGDGREGLERLRQSGGIDLALVDQNMPDMDGLSFLRAVRAATGYGDLRVIMIIGQADQAQADAAQEAGADDFLVKPPSREALLGKLQRLALVPE
jgi:two-component system chemotaxis response regulator CheY